jgi:hypothetical protein
LTIVHVLVSSQRATQALPVAFAAQGAVQMLPTKASAQLALKPMLLGATYALGSAAHVLAAMQAGNNRTTAVIQYLGPDKRWLEQRTPWLQCCKQDSTRGTTAIRHLGL